MPDSKDIASYPEWFFSVARTFADGRSQLEVELEGKGSAYVARRQFYSWRKLVQAAGIPGMEEIRNVSISLASSGTKWKLIFRKNAGITPESLASLLTPVAGGNVTTRTPDLQFTTTGRISSTSPNLTEVAANPPDDDATEELVGRLLGATKRGDAS